MVQAIIDIEDQTNRILNVVKAKFGLKDKSAAINLMAEQYANEIMEPSIRPEYLEKLKGIKNQKGIRFKNIEELKKSIKNA